MGTKFKSLAIIGGMLLGMAASGAALADHGWHGGHARYSFGVYVGAPVYPLWGYRPVYYPPYTYYPQYPYYPPVAAPVVVSSPPVYVEQPAAVQPAPQANYWYYCNASRAYYPYVKECPGGWQRVTPQPG